MQLTNWQRVKKLFSNLISNPDLIYPWLKYSLIYNGLPADLNLPWWSYRAIEEADKIAPGRKIFEYGTGGSTLRYGAVAESITSIEDDEKWFSIMQDRIHKKSFNATICYHYFDFKNPSDFFNSTYLKSIDNIDWNLLIIDGQDETFRERITCFKYAEKRAKPGCVIIVDDFWRYEELLQNNRANKVDVFESVGPCRIGVTSTAFFYY